MNIVKNQSRNFVIINKANLCKNIFCKAFGFMFRFKKPDKALVFVFSSERRADLHMLFVFFPIDVLFLNKDKRIVDVKKGFKPFSYYAPKLKAQFVVELPIGMLKNTAVGDEISFI